MWRIFCIIVLTLAGATFGQLLSGGVAASGPGDSGPTKVLIGSIAGAFIGGMIGIAKRWDR
jgi:hypothetical protein